MTKDSEAAINSPLPPCGGARPLDERSEGGELHGQSQTLTPLPALPHKGGGARLHPWRSRAIYAAVGVVLIVSAIAGGVAGLFQAFGPAPLGRDLEVSTLVLDRNGKLLRAYLTSQGRWRLPATREQADTSYLDALLTYEDKRFFHHRGVDPLALMRA